MQAEHREIRTRFFTAMWSRPFTAGWFRVGRSRFGLSLRDHRNVPPLLSERYGKGERRYLHVGPWCLSTLRKWPG